MKSTDSKLNEKIILLKAARLQLLQLHKLLVDFERTTFEQKNGQMTSGQFLNVLINDQDFQWLKKFSSLIVEIDEMFDLDDGASEQMIDNHLFRMKKLLELNDLRDEFTNLYTKVLQSNSEIQLKHEQLEKFLAARE